MMKDFYSITNDTLQVSGPILFITAAGGVLGKVIASTQLVTFIKDNASVLAAVGLLFPGQTPSLAVAPLEEAEPSPAG